MKPASVAPAKPTAKRFLLQLLNALEGQRAPVAALIEAAAVMGISGNNVRVTLARLKADGLVVGGGPAKGSGGGATYGLGERARAVQRHVSGWRDLESRVREWEGAWIGVHSGDLSRSDRKLLSRVERALRFFGFRTFGRGLEIRPSNLALPLPHLRARLGELGLPPTATLFEIRELGDAESRARGLWDGPALDRIYGEGRGRLEASLGGLDGLSPQAAARETFLVGTRLLYQMATDPLLPEPLVDRDARRAWVAAMAHYDDVGRRFWARIMGLEAPGAPRASTAPDSPNPMPPEAPR